MNKIKSILALLLLGGLVATGCADKNANNGGSQPNNSGSSQSGDSGQQGGGGGGQQGGGQQGGEGGGQQGGGGQTSNDAFTGVKLTVESISVNPESKQAEVVAEYSGASISFFAQDNAAEMVVPIGVDGFQAMFGTFALSENNTIATITPTQSYDTVNRILYPIPEGYADPIAVSYDATTTKYTTIMDVSHSHETVLATFTCVASGVAEHVVMPDPIPVEWPTATITANLGLWGVEHDTVPACDVQGVSSVTVLPEDFTAESAYFGISLTSAYSKMAPYIELLEDAGYTLSAGFYSTTNNEIKIMVVGDADHDTFGILIYKVTAPSIIYVDYTLNFTFASNNWLEDDGCFVAAWVFGGSYGEGAWKEITKVGDVYTLAHIDSQATAMNVVRFASGETPAWSSTYYNQTSDISLPGSSGTINIPHTLWA